MIETTAYGVKKRPLPEALKQLLPFNEMNEHQTQNFVGRLRYIEEIAYKIGEWLTSPNSPDDNRAFLNRIELDLMINLGANCNPAHVVSPWLVHSSWSFGISANEMKAALNHEIITLIEKSDPGFNCEINEFKTAIARLSEGLILILDNFYSGRTDVELISNFIAIDLVLTKALTAVVKSRLNEAL